jgi:hypothetical protein
MKRKTLIRWSRPTVLLLPASDSTHRILCGQQTAKSCAYAPEA